MAGVASERCREPGRLRVARREDHAGCRERVCLRRETLRIGRGSADGRHERERTAGGACFAHEPR